MKGRKLTKEDFIATAQKVHGDKYDYSLVEYTNAQGIIKIICPTHGVFEQKASKHLYSKCGCPHCAGNMRMTTQEFINESKSTHGNLYDYSETEYINALHKITIKCPKHGEFKQFPYNHLKDQGCPLCAEERNKSRFICGVGYNDIKNGSSLCGYGVWKSMIQRCYDENYKTKHPAYKNCTCCNEWLLFSNFKKWYDTQPHHEEHGNRKIHLDKDIFSNDDGFYSPQTCCLIPNSLNTALSYRVENPKGLPKGVYIHRGRYSVKGLDPRTNKRKHIGTFADAKSAYEAYRHNKIEYLTSLAYGYLYRGEISKRIYDGILEFIKRLYA